MKGDTSELCICLLQRRVWWILLFLFTVLCKLFTLYSVMFDMFRSIQRFVWKDTTVKWLLRDAGAEKLHSCFLFRSLCCQILLLYVFAGPARDWKPVQGVSCLHPTVARAGSSILLYSGLRRWMDVSVVFVSEIHIGLWFLSLWRHTKKPDNWGKNIKQETH